MSELKEQIAKRLVMQDFHIGFSKVEQAWKEASDAERMVYLLTSDTLLSLVITRIKEIENPYETNPIGDGYYGKGFEKARTKIIEALGGSGE